MTSIQIHEFSTGIRPQINADGSWVSLGFTGQYMNATIDPIPYAVERSIANKEFAVAEGAFSDQPAVIGRVVLDNENSGWSVVALVSRGQDEKGRSASFYRYFLCEGIDNLSSIVAWIESYEQDNHSKPIFNPSDTKVLGQATEFNHQNVSYSQTNFVANSDSTPIIIHPNEKRTLEQINNLATKNANGQPVAWAVNVEALEKPWSFIVIQAASDRAYEILQRTAANSPKNKAPVVDEQALKSAIKSLMGSSTVKSEAVDTVTEALGNNQVNEQYWHTLFDEQGARNAISQKIYNRQMVRLLTLRVLVIPETLPEYLDWLNVKENANRRDLNSNIISSLEFQSNLTNLIYSQPENSILKNKLDALFKKLKVYQPSAKLLEKLGDYCSNNLHNSELSLLYYQLAAYFSARTNNQNVIPNKLFQKAFSHHRGYENIFDTKIYSQQYQQYLRRQGELIVPIPNAYILTVFAEDKAYSRDGKIFPNMSRLVFERMVNDREIASARFAYSQNKSNKYQSIGWIRIGAVKNTGSEEIIGERLTKTLPISIFSKTVPAVGEQVTLKVAANLRKSAPQAPDYQFAKKLGVSRLGQKIVKTFYLSRYYFLQLFDEILSFPSVGITEKFFWVIFMELF